jgi:hypothetical protein
VAGYGPVHGPATVRSGPVHGHGPVRDGSDRAVHFKSLMTAQLIVGAWFGSGLIQSGYYYFIIFYLISLYSGKFF